MNHSTIVIDALLHTVGPLCIKMPVPQGGRENMYGQFPVLTRGIGSGGKPVQTGFLPATTLRGFIRRAVVMHDMRLAAQANNHYTLQKAYAELIGQDAGSESSFGQIDLLKQKSFREANPVIDLFGAGLHLKSRLLMSHFLPQENVLPERFSGVRKDIEDTPEAFNALLPETQAAYANRSDANSLRSAAAAQVKSLKKQFAKAQKSSDSTELVESLIEQINAAERLAEQHAQDMGEMQNSSRTVIDYYALPAGIDLYGRLIIERARDRDVEMLTHALNALSHRPILGGYAARGCGEIAGKFTFKVNGEELKIVKIGGWAPAQTVMLNDQARISLDSDVQLNAVP